MSVSKFLKKNFLNLVFNLLLISDVFTTLELFQ